MKRKRTNFRVSFGVTTLLLLGAAIALAAVLDNLPGARVDLTSDRLYTMSPAAVKILSELKVPVQVRLYITGVDRMPTEWKTLERDIMDKMSDYQRASKGKLEFSIFDPQDDEEMQEQLTQKGIRPFQVQKVERDAMGVQMVWSAMTVAYKDYPDEIIPQVLPQSLPNLEYELVSRVYRLTRESNPKVALFAPKQPVDQQTMMMYMQMGMQPPQPQDVYQGVRQLLSEEHYDVTPIELTAASRIPADADVLLVLNPLDLNERQVFEINRALSNGLSTVLALQAHEYNYMPAPRGGFNVSGRQLSSGLDTMLEEFGVTVGKDHFFDESMQVISMGRTQTVMGMRFQTNEPVQFPIQIFVTGDQMNSDSPMANRISNLLYLWGTQLELNDSALARGELKSTTLFTSSDRSWAEEFSEGVVAGSYFSTKDRQFLGRQPLAALVTGEFPDTFQGEPLPPWPAAGGEDEPQPEADHAPPLSPAPAQLLVIGCAKMFDDQVLQAGQNALLLLNAVDGLAHGSDLISIRSKQLTERVIKPVSDSKKFGYRLFVTALVPAALAVFGISRAAVRRKEAALYREQLAQRQARA
jgi:ABC-type uncharacterized transport system involved in gliding motility auxiliary subunit